MGSKRDLERLRALVMAFADTYLADDVDYSEDAQVETFLTMHEEAYRRGV